jgi:hypothetical protein
VVIRGQATPTLCGGERPAGSRVNGKRMATVGAVYSIDPYVRGPEEVVAALFRDANYTPPPRPQPCCKHVWASLPQGEGQEHSSMDMVFDWLLWEYVRRNPDSRRPTVYLCDGQETLWQACHEYLPDQNATEILDLLHVTPRLWQAAKLFCGEKSRQVVPFVRQRLTQVLQGKVATVVRGLRRLATEQKLSAAKRKVLRRICRYLDKNRQRMRYDEYLAKGYPIASGVIEGACRHVIKDGLERAGMHWTVAGAQAMWDVRSVSVSGQWQAFQQYRIERATARLYPYRQLVAGEAFFTMAASRGDGYALPGEDEVLGVGAAVLHYQVHRFCEVGVTTDGLFADFELFPQFLCGGLLVSLTRSLVGAGTLLLRLQVTLAAEVTLSGGREVTATELGLDDERLHCVPVGELLLNHWEGLLVLSAPTQAVVSVYHGVVVLPDDQGIAAALSVEASVEVGQFTGGQRRDQVLEFPVDLDVVAVLTGVVETPLARSGFVSHAVSTSGA